MKKIFLLAAIWVVGSFVFADTLSLPDFSLDLPAGWVKMNQEAVKVFSRGSDGTRFFALGYAPRKQEFIDPPCLVIKFNEIPTMKNMLFKDVVESFAEEFKSPDGSPGMVVVDSSRWNFSTVSMLQGMPVYMSVSVGEKGFVRLFYFLSAEKPQQEMDQFRQVLNSIEFAYPFRNTSPYKEAQQSRDKNNFWFIWALIVITVSLGGRWLMSQFK